MHIAACAIPAYLNDESRVSFFLAGEYQGTLTAGECTLLAERELIHGVGSHRRLRHVILQCSLDDALVAIQVSKPVERKGSIMTAASRTIAREKINGERITFVAYKHTGKRTFAPHLRTEFA